MSKSTMAIIRERMSKQLKELGKGLEAVEEDEEDNYVLRYFYNFEDEEQLEEEKVSTEDDLPF